MASSSSSTSPTLVTELESAYASLVSTLTAEDFLHEKSPDVLKAEEEKFQRFLSLARAVETWFLQRRQLIYGHKPELMLKEETQDLKQELAKKDELLRRHLDKLAQWQGLLQDVPVGAQPSQSHQQQAASRLAPSATVVAPGAPMQPGVGAPQGGFVPGNNYRSPHMIGPGAMGGQGGGAHQQHIMMQQDHLSYLEKSAANVGGGGPMGR